MLRQDGESLDTALPSTKATSGGFGDSIPTVVRGSGTRLLVRTQMGGLLTLVHSNGGAMNTTILTFVRSMLLKATNRAPLSAALFALEETEK